MSRNETVLVAGATGHQGGAAARNLLADGWRVRALTRDPDSPAASALAAAGAEVVLGDLTDPASLVGPATGVYGVYSVGTPAQEGTEGEIAMGRNIADAAVAAGARHLVYSSVSGVGDAGNRAVFVVGKRAVEEYLAGLDIPTTVWRPVTFMENFLRSREAVADGVLPTPQWPESSMFYIAVNDIGRFVALAFAEPERFAGTTLEIAGDHMTVAQAAATFSDVLGRTVEARHTEMPGVASPPRPVPGAPVPIRADIGKCREIIPDLLWLKDWIGLQEWT